MASGNSVFRNNRSNFNLCIQAGDERCSRFFRNGNLRLLGQIGMITGWYSPVEQAVAKGATANTPGVMEWLGLILVSFILPGVLTWLFGLLFRKIGWIKDGDLKLIEN